MFLSDVGFFLTNSSHSLGSILPSPFESAWLNVWSPKHNKCQKKENEHLHVCCVTDLQYQRLPLRRYPTDANPIHLEVPRPSPWAGPTANRNSGPFMERKWYLSKRLNVKMIYLFFLDVTRPSQVIQFECNCREDRKSKTSCDKKMSGTLPGKKEWKSGQKKTSGQEV